MPQGCTAQQHFVRHAKSTRRTMEESDTWTVPLKTCKVLDKGEEIENALVLAFASERGVVYYVLV